MRTRKNKTFTPGSYTVELIDNDEETQIASSTCKTSEDLDRLIIELCDEWNKYIDETHKVTVWRTVKEKVEEVKVSKPKSPSYRIQRG